jgi:hypothetical protein
VWSESSKKQTREFFQKYERGAMKHSGGSRYGICFVSEKGFNIVDRKTKEAEFFESIEELIDSGWVID